MALIVKDRIKETTTTTGTGTVTLSGASAGFQSFSAVGDTNTTYYAIVSGNDWEVGLGTYTASGTTLSRDTILESSNGGSAITLAGTSTVFCTYPAEKSVVLNGTVINDANVVDTVNIVDDAVNAAKINVAGNGTSGQYLVSDGDGSMSWLTPPAGGVPSGTKQLFVQTAAPTGWTKDTTHNDKALRVVSGAASSGGSVAFETAFASKTPTGSVTITSVTGSAGNTTLSTPQIPSHNHAGIGSTGFVNSPPAPVNGVGRVSYTIGMYNMVVPGSGIQINNTGARGGGGSHNHPFSFSSGAGTFSGNAIDLDVSYVDVIIATKD